MNRFLLIRETDVTGISGTGIVAEGIEFIDGTVVVRWLDTAVSQVPGSALVKPTTVIHADVQSVIALHGHDGATVIQWLDR